MKVGDLVRHKARNKIGIVLWVYDLCDAVTWWSNGMKRNCAKNALEVIYASR